MGTGKIIFLEHLGLQLDSFFSDKGFPSIVVWSCPSAPNLSSWEGVSIGGGYVPRVQESEGLPWGWFPGLDSRASERHP